MENLVLISAVLGIHIFAWFTPGPITILIIRNSLLYSRGAGLWTATGIAIGNLVHIIYSVTGIALIIASSSIMFNVIKFLGVGYITYLGVKTLLITDSKFSIQTKGEHKDISAFNAAKIGFITNILSPKASLFFASIFANVYAAKASIWVIVFLMIAMPLNSLFMASLYSVFFTQERIRKIYKNYQGIFNKILGVALIFLAALIIFIQ